MDDLPGLNTSLWIDTTDETSYSPIETEDSEHDVVIIGGGITGILCAWKLQSDGFDVALIEKSRIAENTTGNTTAKLTSQHYLIYKELIKQHGKETAQAYADANQNALSEIKETISKLKIDCDLEPADAYVYTNQQEKIGEIEAEVLATQSLGLPSFFTEKTELPLPTKAAIKYTGQAQFHPRKFLLRIAEEFIHKGGHIFENTEAKDIIPGESSHTVVTSKRKLKGKYVIEATKYPFWRPEIFEKAMWTKLSYALGVIIEDDYPMNMYITTDQPMRTIRSHPYKDGRILIFGGESHKMEKGYDKNLHYKNLIDAVNRHYKVKEVVYKWIAGDAMPYDLMPYIGAYPDQPNIYISTGYRAWGLVWAMAASNIICASIRGESLAWAKHFSLERLNSN